MKVDELAELVGLVLVDRMELVQVDMKELVQVGMMELVRELVDMKELEPELVVQQLVHMNYWKVRPNRQQLRQLQLKKLDDMSWLQQVWAAQTQSHCS